VCGALHVPPCRTAGDKFNKEYAYNVRYNYGQEGKRQDWSEWSCVKIINQVRHRQHNLAAAAAAAAVACTVEQWRHCMLRAAVYVWLETVRHVDEVRTQPWREGN
jgi:DNA primase large subunit